MYLSQAHLSNPLSWAPSAISECYGSDAMAGADWCWGGGGHFWGGVLFYLTDEMWLFIVIVLILDSGMSSLLSIRSCVVCDNDK